MVSVSVPANQTLGRGGCGGVRDSLLRPEGPSPKLAQLGDPDPRGPRATATRKARGAGRREGGARAAVACELLSGASGAEPAERSGLLVPAVPGTSTVKVRSEKLGSAEPVGHSTVSGTLLFVFMQGIEA